MGMKRLSLLFVFLGTLFGLYAQNANFRFQVRRTTDNQIIELRATDGLFVDAATGTLRTLRNAGIQGTPLTVWVNGTDGKGVAVPLQGAQIALVNSKPVLVVNQPPVPPQLKVKTNVHCIPNVDGSSWVIPFTEGTITDIVVYRNGIRQSRVSSPNYVADYSSSPNFLTLTPAPNYPWSILRTDVQNPQKPDLIVADVFYY
jgi:hypothetical protein